MSEQQPNLNVNLPDYVKETFEKIFSLTGTPISEIQLEYEDFLMKNTEYLNGSSFVDDEQRYRYVNGVIWMRYRSLQPTKKFIIIPLGFESWRYTKSKRTKITTIYVAKMDGQNIKKVDIPLFESNVDIAYTMNIGQSYTVSFTENSKTGTLGADRRTVFSNPQMVNIDILSLYKKVGVILVPTLAETPKFLSRQIKTSTGEFTDKLDWRIVRGWISNLGSGIKKDEAPWARYTLIDQSLGTEETVDEKGNVVRAGLDCWLDPSLIKYGRDSEVYIVGTISKSKEGVISINAINVIPIHAFPLEN